MERIEQKDGFNIEIFQPMDDNYIAMLQIKTRGEQRISFEKQSIPALIEALKKYVEWCQTIQKQQTK